MCIAGFFLRALSDASGLVGPAMACAGGILPYEHAADSSGLTTVGAATFAGQPSTSAAKPAGLACDSSLASDHECTFDTPMAETWRLLAASAVGVWDRNAQPNLGYTFVWMSDVPVAQSNGVEERISPMPPLHVLSSSITWRN